MGSKYKNYNVNGECSANTFAEVRRCKYSVTFGMSECVFCENDKCVSVPAGVEKGQDNGI